ncbi:MAG TPA: DUF2975 domain-containing protein [Sphingomonas sp.]
MRRDRVLKLSSALLWVMYWLNILGAVGFLAFLLFSFGFHDTLVGLLARKYAGRLDIGMLIEAMRLMMITGLAAIAVAWVIITRLQAIIATVAAGDPFVAANARRLQAIGWALLGWQLVDLAMGGVIIWTERIGADTAGWTPNVAGWLVTLLVFVLARVFAVGTAMRDELEGTI